MSVYAGPADWWTDGTNDGRTHIATKGVVQSGLVLNLDAGVSSSYPGSGTTWTDLSGNNNNGTLTNGPTFSSGNGGSIVFDGVNDYGTLSDNTVADNLNAMTVSVWIYRDWSEVIPLQTPIVNKMNYPVTDPGWQLSVRYKMSFRFYTAQSEPIYNYKYITQANADADPYLSNVMSQGFRWLNIVVMYSGGVSGPISYYFDARPFTNLTDISSGTVTSSSTTAPILLAGNTVNGRYLNCRISNTAIYNRALSAAEITQNFNALRGRFGI